MAARADMTAIGAFSRPGAGAGAGPARRCAQIWWAAPCAPRRAACRLKLRRARGGADGPLCVSGGPVAAAPRQLCALSAARQPESAILGQKVWVVPGRSSRLCLANSPRSGGAAYVQYSNAGRRTTPLKKSSGSTGSGATHSSTHVAQPPSHPAGGALPPLPSHSSFPASIPARVRRPGQPNGGGGGRARGV